MVTTKLNMIKTFLILFTLLCSTFAMSETNIDQWNDSKKTYKDLINEGFEVKGYSTATIEPKGGLIIIMFVSVLQKDKEVYECQEYQTLDSGMKTLDMSLVCRELSQPYKRGVGT